MSIDRLSGFDTSLLRLESPGQPMTISLLMELDTATMPEDYTFERFRAALSQRIAGVTEFRLKLAAGPLRIGTPVWTPDPHFDLDHHLQRRILPASAGRAEASALVGDLIATPLNRQRPLWEMWVIEGGPDGGPGSSRITLLAKIHHAMMDGTSSRDLFSRLFSTEPEEADAQVPAAVPDVALPSRRELLRDGVVQLRRRGKLLAAKVVPDALRMAARTGSRALTGRGTAGVLGAPRTLFNAPITPARAVGTVRIDLADVKNVKNRFGVKVNDVMLAMVSGALRQYLLDRNALPDASLVAMMPIGVVVEDDGIGRNNMSAMFARLHTDIADPVQRLAAIAHASSQAKEVSADIGGSLLRDSTECLPGLLSGLMRAYTWTGLPARKPLFNVSVSNVIGSQVPSFLLGAAVRANYPLGPVLHGVGLNVSLGSYDGGIDIGVVACADLMPDVWQLTDLFPRMLDELAALAA